MKEDIYLYKLTVDSGGAPCVAKGLLSLAICKPQIRASAEVGCWLFGFGSNQAPMSNRLIYIARVTDKLSCGEYYSRDEFRVRPDCIYERTPEKRLSWRRGAKFHGPDDIPRDVGIFPLYERANVLLSADFRYFGREGTVEYRNRYPAITAAVAGLGQGHRVNHVKMLRDELVKLQRDIWRSYCRKQVLGRPTLEDTSLACNSNDPCRTIKRKTGKYVSCLLQGHSPRTES